MKYTKKVSLGGGYLKKDEELHNEDLITILNEGQPVEGDYGTQNLFMVKTKSGSEGNVSFNTTTINNLIDAYGEDSLNWVGKTVKVWKILQNIQGKMKNVYYFLHTDTQLDKDGNFYLPNIGKEQGNTLSVNSAVEPANEPVSEVKVSEIPF